MNDKEKKALNMIRAQHPFKRRVTKGKKRFVTKPKFKTAKNDRILQALLIAKPKEKIYLGTQDVEMFKWSFKEDTGRTINLVDTKSESIYVIELQDERI